MSVYFDCLTEAAAEIDALDLEGAPSVAIRTVPVDRNIGSGKSLTMPAIVVAPQRDTEGRGGVTGLDDIIYGVWVVIVAVDNQETTLAANLPEYLLWREQIARHFRSRRLDVAGIINTTIQTADAVLPEGWKKQLYVSALALQFTSREARGIS